MTKAILLILALALGGCASMAGSSSLPTATPSEAALPSVTNVPTASPTPSVEPTLPEWFNRTPSPECVNPPPDLMTVIFTEHKVECYGRMPLTVSGIIDGIGTYDPLLRTEPAWLAMPHLTLRAIVDETGAQAQPITLAAHQQGVARPSTWTPPDLWVVAHPASGIELADYMLRAVTVVGHFDDPAAATCHYLEDYTAIGFPPEDAVRYCRAQFVVTEMVLGSARRTDAPVIDRAVQAEVGSVVFVIVIRGDIDPGDDFRFALDTVPPGRIIEPVVWICGPEGPWSPVPHCRAGHGYVRDSGRWPVGTVLRYALAKGDSGVIPALSGTVTVTATTQTLRLTYDYDYRSMPDTALPEADAPRPPS